MENKSGLKKSLKRFDAWVGPCLSAILIAAIMGAVLLSFHCGTDRGDDRTLAKTGYANFIPAVCGIATRIKYDRHYFCFKEGGGRYVCSKQGRYVCSSGIYQQMQQVGLWFDEETRRRIGKTDDEWRADTKLLNHSLDRIFSLKAPPEGIVFSFGWGGDAGYMDFVQFAFLLFGHTVQALYYGFFLLLAISAGVFCVQFWRRHFALFAVLAFTFALLTFVRLMPFAFLGFDTGAGLDSITNPRRLSALTLIPLFHALFLIVYRVRLSLWPVILFTPQAILMAAAADFRSLAFASPLALTICCLIFLVCELWRHKQPLRQTLSHYWPAYLIFACIGMSAAIQAEAADGRLAAIGGMRIHSFWEPVYYDLQYHPQWKEKYAAEHHWKTGDDVAVVAAELYEQRHHLPHWTSDLGYERAVRGAYIDFVRNDPWYVVQLKYYDALTVIDFVASVIAIEWPRMIWPTLIFAAFVAAALVSQIRRKQESLGTLTAYTAALGFCTVLIAIPIWATVVEVQNFFDFTLCFIAWTSTAALVTFVAAVLFLSEHVPRLGIRLPLRRPQ